MLKLALLIALFSASTALAQKKPKVSEQTPSTKSAPIAPVPETQPRDVAPVPTVPADPAVPAPPPEVVPPSPTPEPIAERPAPTDSRMLLGVHAAIGLPHPTRFGLTYIHPSKLFSVEGNIGSYGMTVDDVDAKMSNMEIGLRWHPFLGAFYVGALLGQRTITAEKTDTILAQSISATAEVKSNYIAPNVGWLWGMGSTGLFVSVDLGLLSPSGVTTTFSSTADGTIQAQPEYETLKKDVEDEGNKLGNTTLPLFTLLKIGWLF